MTTEFRCPECGEGRVAVRQMAGRKALAFPGVDVELPESLAIPTCDRCFEWSYPESQQEEFEAAVAVALGNWQKLELPGRIAALCERHAITRQRLAAALDVGPSYLSNVASGAKAASAMLLRLLFAYEDSPAFLNHVLAGKRLVEFATAERDKTIQRTVEKLIAVNDNGVMSPDEKLQTLFYRKRLVVAVGAQIEFQEIHTVRKWTSNNVDEQLSTDRSFVASC